MGPLRTAEVSMTLTFLDPRSGRRVTIRVPQWSPARAWDRLRCGPRDRAAPGSGRKGVDASDRCAVTRAA